MKLTKHQRTTLLILWVCYNNGSTLMSKVLSYRELRRMVFEGQTIHVAYQDPYTYKTSFLNPLPTQPRRILKAKTLLSSWLLTVKRTAHTLRLTARSR